MLWRDAKWKWDMKKGNDPLIGECFLRILEWINILGVPRSQIWTALLKLLCLGPLLYKWSGLIDSLSGLVVGFGSVGLFLLGVLWWGWLEAERWCEQDPIEMGLFSVLSDIA
jgi:hypothetical protein